MYIQEFFGYTKIKLITFTVLSILMNILKSPFDLAVETTSGGYTIHNYGLPFTSYNSSFGLNYFGILWNIIAAYLIVCILFYTYKQYKK